MSSNNQAEVIRHEIVYEWMTLSRFTEYFRGRLTQEEAFPHFCMLQRSGLSRLGPTAGGDRGPDRQVVRRRLDG